MSTARVILLIAFVVALDLATKWIVSATMTVGQSIPIIDGYFSLTYVRNPGAAFGLLGDAGNWGPLVLVAVSIAAVAALGWLLVGLPESQKWERAAAAAVIGGALGNLHDRLRFGEVVDFLDVYVGTWHWPAFNVADSAISVGVVVLVLTSFRAQPDASSEVVGDADSHAR